MGTGVGLGWRERSAPLPSHRHKNARGTNDEVSSPVRTGSDTLAARTACSLLQLLSELHSWGEDSSLLPGLGAQDWHSSLSSRSWPLPAGRGAGTEARKKGAGGGEMGGTFLLLIEQLISMFDEPACLLVANQEKCPACCSWVRSSNPCK